MRRRRRHGSSERLAPLAAVLLACSVGSCGSESPERIFDDPDRPIEERVDNIVALMTLDEKIWALAVKPSVDRLGIRGSGELEGIHGLALGGPGGWGGTSPTTTTQFPQGVGLGETWDPEILRLVATAEGEEARYAYQALGRGALVVRAPNADLARDPRWGRSEESYGEDAFLTGTLTTAFVKGLQGDHPTYWRAASLLKHFMANSNEDTRSYSSSDFDERLLREYYSEPFRAGIVDGGARAFMAAYNAVNGIPMTVHPVLRNMVMREWGFDGIICTDADAFQHMVTRHRYYSSFDRAAAEAVRAGINRFLDFDTKVSQQALHDALDHGLLTEEEIDRELKGAFRVMIRLGLLDPPERVPYSTIGSDPRPPWVTDERKALVRKVTRESIVLLKNNGLLPLDRSRLRSIAVIGPFADQVLLDWYSGTPPYSVSPLAGIGNKVGSAVSVFSAPDNRGGWAASVAAYSDVAIVVVGNDPVCRGDSWGHCSVPSDGREAVDRKAITLEQEALIQQVFAANRRTVVVLRSSFPYAIEWTQANVPAIVHMAHGSQEEGNALADVLFGDVNPGGRLVTTWPRTIGQVPPLMDYDLRHGRTYMYFRDTPLYPFGYGLSYTSFDYSDLRTSGSRLALDGEITVTVDVTNTGARAGDEVVQMYVRHPESRVSRPLRELRGFQRVSLRPGETRSVALALSASALAYFDVPRGQYVVEPETIVIEIGASSSDIRLRQAMAVGS